MPCHGLFCSRLRITLSFCIVVAATPQEYQPSDHFRITSTTYTLSPRGCDPQKKNHDQNQGNTSTLMENKSDSLLFCFHSKAIDAALYDHNEIENWRTRSFLTVTSRSSLRSLAGCHTYWWSIPRVAVRKQLILIYLSFGDYVFVVDRERLRRLIQFPLTIQVAADAEECFSNGLK